MKYALALLLVLPASLSAETIRLIVPYTGSLTNKYVSETYGLSLRDTGEMHGFFAQWLNTEKFQVNAFVYTAPVVNYSDVDGLHLNADYYLRPTPAGKWVLGAGLETLDIKMDAGRNIPGLTAFALDNTVSFYYGRAGRYFYYKKGWLSSSLLPYAGWARETVAGELRLNPAGPAPAMTIDIDDSDSHALAGLNLNATIAHFIDLQGKWMGRFKDGATLDEYSLMVNIFLNRHWGLSYRYKYMEYGSSSNGYHLGGVAYVF